MNNFDMLIEKNRRKYLTPKTNILRPKNAIFLNCKNTPRHEIFKTIMGIMLGRWGDIKTSPQLIARLNELEDEIFNVMKDFPKDNQPFISEASPVNNPKRIIDIVRLSDEQHFEGETDHKIKKLGAYSFYI